jgi:hypothetical protein
MLPGTTSPEGSEAVGRTPWGRTKRAVRAAWLTALCALPVGVVVLFVTMVHAMSSGAAGGCGGG